MPVAVSDVRRFDGKWLVTNSCKPTADAPGFAWQFLANVKDGVFKGVHGVVGKPDSIVFEGMIKADGEAEISADFTGGGAFPAGAKFAFTVAAKFEDSRGTGVRLGGRICDYVFAKQ
jgi:hypothetical protein